MPPRRAAQRAYGTFGALPIAEFLESRYSTYEFRKQMSVDRMPEPTRFIVPVNRARVPGVGAVLVGALAEKHSPLKLSLHGNGASLAQPALALPQPAA